jgi:hypothetical protein
MRGRAFHLGDVATPDGILLSIEHKPLPRRRITAKVFFSSQSVGSEL